MIGTQDLHKRSLAALLLAFMAMLMLAGCSSSDESSSDSSGCETGDKGICCDVDPMQPGCAG